MRTRLLATLSFAAALLSTACSMKPVHVETLPVRYASAPAPDQVETPLLVVLDPQLVPDTMRTTDPQTKKVDVYGVQTFVRRDVARVLGDFFRQVAVVAPGQAPPAGSYVAEVRVVGVDTTAEQRTSFATNGTVAMSHRAFGVIDWSIVIRDADTQKIVYSFSDRAIGSFALTTVDETEPAIASAIETAMLRFIQDLRDRRVTETLRAHAEEKRAATARTPAE